MAGQAKEQREEWEVKLKRTFEALNTAATTEPANKRVIFGEIKKVEITFEKLLRAHSKYCGIAKIGLRSRDSTEYLRGQVRLKVASVTAAEEALGETCEEAEAKESLCKLESELFQLSIDLQEKLTCLASLASTALLTRE